MMPNPWTEPFNARDPQAIEQLYGAWRRPLCNYLNRIARSPGQTEDLFQETWTRAWERRGQLRDNALFGPWLFQIARNLALMERRKGRRQGQVCFFASLEEVDGWPPNEGPWPPPKRPSLDPWSGILRRDQRQLMLRIMRDLDTQTQRMLELRYFQWFSLAEIADQLNVPLGTVCAKIHRGLKVLNRRLRELGFQASEEL